MYTALDIFESLINGQSRQATNQLIESNYSLYSLVDELRAQGHCDTEILNEIKKLRI